MLAWRSFDAAGVCLQGQREGDGGSIAIELSNRVIPVELTYGMFLSGMELKGEREIGQTKPRVNKIPSS